MMPALGRIFYAVLLLLPEVVKSLKDVVLDIEPRVVRLGEQSILQCTYDIGDDPLYTVKWYRGNHEFYRYTPSEHPSTKVFPFRGVDVDLQQSNEHQVVLRNVGFSLSGNFSCEVTTDAPLFLTKVASEQMLVVVLPTGPPTLVTDRSSYELGDTLRANCTSAPSRPAATLKFLLNNIVVCEKCKTVKHPLEELWWSQMNLVLPLFSNHFSGGRLALRCIAQVANLYQQDTELILYNERDPIPERVTSPNQALRRSASYLMNLSLLLYVKFIIV